MSIVYIHYSGHITIQCQCVTLNSFNKSSDIDTHTLNRNSLRAAPNYSCGVHYSVFQHKNNM